MASPRVVTRALSAGSRIKQNVGPLQQRRWATQANDREGMLASKGRWEAFPEGIRKLAVFAEHARSNNYQIPLLSKARNDGFDQAKAYHITAAVRQLREMNGDVVAGRKIGFTNTNIWSEYNINESNWSYMYEQTMVELPSPVELEQGKVVVANISHLNAMEPRIEPEIAFGLKEVPRSTMSDLEILACIEWISHGFEVVASIYPHWKFTTADTTAAFALHGLLLVGPRRQLAGKGDASLLAEMESFTVDLVRNGEKVDVGKGSNVLGSPVKALKHLTELLEKDEQNLPLQKGETITTGTLTNAFTIKEGDLWSTKVSGIDLPGLDVKFTLR